MDVISFFKQDGRLEINDAVLIINGEAISDKTTDDISAMIKEIEERSGSVELLVRRETPISLSPYDYCKISQRQPMLKRRSLQSQLSSQTPKLVRFLF
jgi:hypothetical protein